MATYANTPRQPDDFLKQQQQSQRSHQNGNSTDQTPRQNTQRSNNDQNYNGFMTQRDQDQNGGQQKSLTLEYGKTIKLLRNGDEFYRGQKVVINSRKYRYFDVFLDDLSDMMQARFGAVRNIHTPIHGHKVKSLDQIEDGKTYVASGAGRFVKLNYMDISEGKRLPANRLPPLSRPIDYNNIQVAQYDKPQSIYIYVYRNGDVLTPPVKVLLPKGTLSSYDAVLNEITNKVQLLNGAVLKLYTMEGEPVLTPAQLISSNGYVAANKEKFKKCEYFSPQDFNHVSPRLNRKSESSEVINKVKPLKKAEITNSQPVSNYNSSNPSTSGKSTFSYPGKPYTGWHKEEKKRENSLPPVIGPKPTNNRQAAQNHHQQQQQKNNLDLDKDQGGIFKAKNRNNNNDAKTVQESRNMYVDMPVDYRKTNQVIDEEIDDRRTNNHSQRPPVAPSNTVAKANSKQPPQHNQDSTSNSKINSEDSLAMNSINLSDVPTIDSSTFSTDTTQETDRNVFYIKYEQIQEQINDELNEFSEHEINNRTYTFETKDDDSNNLTRTLEVAEVTSQVASSKNSHAQIEQENLVPQIQAQSLVYMENLEKIQSGQVSQVSLEKENVEPAKISQENLVKSQVDLENEEIIQVESAKVSKVNFEQTAELKTPTPEEEINRSPTPTEEQEPIVQELMEKVLDTVETNMALVKSRTSGFVDELTEAELKETELKRENSYVLTNSTKSIAKSTRSIRKESISNQTAKLSNPSQDKLSNASNHNFNNNQHNNSSRRLDLEENIRDLDDEDHNLHTKSKQSIAINSNRNSITHRKESNPIIDDDQDLNKNNHQINDTSRLDMNDQQAATLIQSFYRGYKTRSELKNKQTNAFD